MTNFLVNTKFVFIVLLLSVKAMGMSCADAKQASPLSELDYLGIPFSGPELCIETGVEKEARARCPSGNLLVNPANPQYREKTQSSSYDAGTSQAKLDFNPQGFYYCIPRATNKTKGVLCDKNTILEQSNWDKKIVKQYDFKWLDKNKGSNKSIDGDCTCRVEGTKNFEICNRQPPQPTDFCANVGLAKADSSEFEKEPNIADLTCARQVCKCPDNKRFFPDSIAKEQCAKEATKPPAPDEKQPMKAAAAGITEPDSNLKECVDIWKKEALNCKKNADEAQKSCGSAKGMTKDEKETAAAVDAANKLYTGQNAGKGAQQECFTASLIANGAKNMLGPKKDTCDTSISACTSACDQNKLSELEQTCSTKISTAEQPADDIYPTPNQKYFMDNETVIHEIADTARKICIDDTKKGQSEISSILSGVGDALSSSVQCMCKLASAGADCTAIPPVSTCDKDPTKPNCSSVYGSVEVCTPGNGYDAKMCSCQLNPKGAGCPGGGLSGGLSNFASPSIKGNGIGDSNFSSIAGGLKPSGSGPDLPVTTADESAASNLQLPPGSNLGGGPSGGSSGGGPSGGSSGGDPNAAGEPAPEEKGGIAGLFNQAKTYMTNSLGLKKPTNGNNKNGKGGSGLDPNKFKPRGLASKRSIGTKNQDIWKMSNDCMYAVTCPRNNNNFLEVPLKQK